MTHAENLRGNSAELARPNNDCFRSSVNDLLMQESRTFFRQESKSSPFSTPASLDRNSAFNDGQMNEMLNRALQFDVYAMGKVMDDARQLMESYQKPGFLADGGRDLANSELMKTFGKDLMVAKAAIEFTHLLMQAQQLANLFGLAIPRGQRTGYGSAGDTANGALPSRDTTNGSKSDTTSPQNGKSDTNSGSGNDTSGRPNDSNASVNDFNGQNQTPKENPGDGSEYSPTPTRSANSSIVSRYSVPADVVPGSEGQREPRHYFRPLDGRSTDPAIARIASDMPGKTVINADFTTGSFNDLNKVFGGFVPQMANLSDGARAADFAIDPYSKPAPLNMRSMISSDKGDAQIKWGKEYWIDMNVNLADWKPDKNGEGIWQIHDTPKDWSTDTTAGRGGRAIGLQVKDGKWQFLAGDNATPQNIENGTYKPNVIFETPYKEGEWVGWKIHMKAAPEGDNSGYLELYKDGVKVAQLQGWNMHGVDVNGQRLQDASTATLGIYKPTWGNNPNWKDFSNGARRELLVKNYTVNVV